MNSPCFPCPTHGDVQVPPSEQRVTVCPRCAGEGLAELLQPGDHVRVSTVELDGQGMLEKKLVRMIVVKVNVNNFTQEPWGKDWKPICTAEAGWISAADIHSLEVLNEKE